jgi:luciferase-like monooxygenase
MDGANRRITAEVTSWPGVTAGYGERGEWGFTVGRKKIGHLHGDRVLHLGLPRRQWEELLREGRVERHPIDHPGWAARRLDGEEDVREALALLRMNYERAVARHGVAA